MRPMLASDYDESKLEQFMPWMAQPKIDGVRALNIDGKLYGRSLKQHRNKFTTQKFSTDLFTGFDGEMAITGMETAPDLCRRTSSALSSIEGQPDITWWVFDHRGLDIRWIYEQRYEYLSEYIGQLRERYEWCHNHIRLVPQVMILSMDHLNQYDTANLDAGFEGTIIRDPYGLYKYGRSTVKERGLLRIKRFEDAEATVVSILEGQTNGNEAQINELGKTFRTSHQENQQPNGQVGTLVCRTAQGLTINVSPGNMDHDTRRKYFEHPDLIVGKVITYKHFPKGVKDKPRFPTFKCIRDDTDMSD